MYNINTPTPTQMHNFHCHCCGGFMTEPICLLLLSVKMVGFCGGLSTGSSPRERSKRLPPSHLGEVLRSLFNPGVVKFVSVKSGAYSVLPWSRSKRLPPSHLGEVLRALHNPGLVNFPVSNIKGSTSDLSWGGSQSLEPLVHFSGPRYAFMFLVVFLGLFTTGTVPNVISKRRVSSRLSLVISWLSNACAIRSSAVAAISTRDRCMICAALVVAQSGPDRTTPLTEVESIGRVATKV